MNTVAGLPQVLVVLIVFLVARAVAGIATAFARPAGFVLAYAAGLMLSALPEMAVVPRLPFMQSGFDLVAGLLLFSSAFLTMVSLPSKSAQHWNAASLTRALVVLALPASGLLVPLIANRLSPAIFNAGTFPPALVLAMALWLLRQGRPLDLLAAAGAWLWLDSASSLATGRYPSTILPYLLLIGSTGLIFALGRVGPVKQGNLGRNLARDGLMALSVLLAASFRLAGASWGLAALATGLVLGFARRNKPWRDAAASMQTLSLESGLACSFAVGLGMGLADSSSNPWVTAIIALVALAVPAFRSLASTTTGKPMQRIAGLLPDSPLPLAMILSVGLESPALRPMAFGLTIACLIAIPASRSIIGGTAISGSGRRRWKPLVAVSRRGNAAGILAFASALADPDQPIRSVCVAAAPGSKGPDAAEAEETLVRAVAAGASSGHRILPSMVTAASTSDGLGRAALERRSDCIIVGWNENPTPSDPDSRSVVDALVRSSPAIVISVRKPEIFNRCKRLVFVTMAGSMPENGYREASALAKAAWGRNPSNMEAVIIGGKADELASALDLDHRQIAALPVWRDLPEAVRRNGSQTPAFFVAAARPDWPGWNPGTERIPLAIADAFPEAALAVFYLKAPAPLGEGAEDETESVSRPGSEGASSAVSGSDRKEGSMNSGLPTDRMTGGNAAWPLIVQAAIQSGRIMTAMKDAALVDAINTLTKTLFPNDRTAASRMATDFSTVARTEPIELAPGILLLHAHAEGIAVPVLAIGVNRVGWRLVALDEVVKIVIMLISPVEAGPAAHLEALTQIAKAIQDHGFAQAILDPERSTEFLPK